METSQPQIICRAEMKLIVSSMSNQTNKPAGPGFEQMMVAHVSQILSNLQNYYYGIFTVLFL